MAGPPNNKLKREAIHGRAVMDKGIIYAPDFTLNAGGVINCYSEVKGLSAEWAIGKAEEIYGTIHSIVSRSKSEGIPTYQIANRMAEERITAIGNVKLPL